MKIKIARVSHGQPVMRYQGSFLEFRQQLRQLRNGQVKVQTGRWPSNHYSLTYADGGFVRMFIELEEVSK